MGSKIKLNQIVNLKEYEKGMVCLESTPTYVTVGAHYKCNAKCKFCLGGDYENFTLDKYKRFFEKKLTNVLASARHIGFCGFGEVLLMPEIRGFIDYLDKTIPDPIKVITTNGSTLKPAICDKITSGNYSTLISLHAAEEALHYKLTGLKKFNEIVENIIYLNKLKVQKKSTLHINLVFLINMLKNMAFLQFSYYE